MTARATAGVAVLLVGLLSGCTAGGRDGSGAGGPDPRAAAGPPDVGSTREGSVTVAPTAWGAHLPDGALAVPAQRNAPVRIRVPSRDLDAPVVGVGVLADGALDLPGDAVTVAWYAGGPAPGESGSSVLAAHVDHDGAPGVFFELAGLTPGAVIEIVRADATVERFTTTAPAQLHPKRSLPLGSLFRRGAEPSLTLITCGGAFDAASGTYEDNVVVTARPLPAA